MSWLRTAVSMIGFGFTIVQFFERFHEMAEVKAAQLPEAPRYLGLMLIATGTLALVIAVAQYHTLVKYLWSETYRPITPDRHALTPTYAASIVLIGSGCSHSSRWRHGWSDRGRVGAAIEVRCLTKLEAAAARATGHGPGRAT
jgi:uncharacterized membrane protein YidH (DUF202 family)